MKLVIGLGNPGEKYQHSRHNMGFMVLEHFLKDIEPKAKTFLEVDKSVKSVIKKANLYGHDIVLAMPTTFMNDSGTAVSLLMQKYKVDPSDIYVVHDDLDLPLGKIKVRMGGAAGGHKGVQSVLDALSTDGFLRIRLGIGKPIRKGGKEKKSYRSVEEYVLSNFEPHETGKVRTMVSETSRIIKLLLKSGIDTYMSKYNKK